MLNFDLFPDEVYVFTPKGSILELPAGATPVDLLTQFTLILATRVLLQSSIENWRRLALHSPAVSKLKLLPHPAHGLILHG